MYTKITNRQAFELLGEDACDTGDFEDFGVWGSVYYATDGNFPILSLCLLDLVTPDDITICISTKEGLDEYWEEDAILPKYLIGDLIGMLEAKQNPYRFAGCAVESGIGEIKTVGSVKI